MGLHSTLSKMDRYSTESQRTRSWTIDIQSQNSRKDGYLDIREKLKKISHDIFEQLVEHHRIINDMLSDPAKVNKLTGFLFGRFSHRADDIITKNLHEEFEKLFYSQAEVSNSTLP